MHNCTGCISLFSLQCVFSNVSSNHLLGLMQNHTGCICLTFVYCVFSNVTSNRLLGRMQSHTSCMSLTFLRYVFSNVSSNCLHKRMHNHTGCICLTFVIEHIRANFWTLCEHKLCGCANVGAFCEYGFVFVLILACEFSCKGSITKLCCFFSLEN